MNIQLLSDLHLEVHPHFVPEPAAGADVLVLAGDIGSYQPGSLLQDDDFGLARFSPLPQYAGWPTPVLLVPGNHEYDGQDFDVAHVRLRRTCDRLGIAWLERETLLLQGARFVGTTLWSDFDALADHEGTTDLTRRLALRHKAFRAADFYLRKTGTTRLGVPFMAQEVREQALICQAWLTETLAAHHPAGPTVVVTHFAPSLRSADPRYGLIPGTAGFCNALDALLPATDLWLHGHLHARSDYAAQGTRADGTAWRCRVVANPLGYARKGEQDTFDPQRCVTV
ncbi:metallophosphoesterase [Acidovorax sp. BL-A-41-H1]|uniref:metallophosphoesterase n=1 Tax=Acidovorax sp. BL-A-41-H1 TaxID=3421102 RepID=UPI003F7A4F04